MPVAKKSTGRRNVVIKLASLTQVRMTTLLKLDGIHEKTSYKDESSGKSSKRKLSSTENNIKSKRFRHNEPTINIFEFLGIRSDSPLIRKCSRYDTTDAKSTSSIPFDSISRSHYYSPAEPAEPVEEVMKKLHQLHFLLDAMHPDGAHRIRASEKNETENGLYSENYKVEKIVDMSSDDMDYLPTFEVKWKGSDTTTWEPLDSLYDCHIFTKYTERKMTEHRGQLNGLWSELTTGRARVSDTSMPDEDAIAQITGFDAFQLQWDLILLIKCRGDAGMRKEAEAIQRRCESTLRLLPYLLKRLEQLRQIYVWQIYINKCDKSSTLRVENEIDFEVPPEDFEYTKDVIPGEGVIILNGPLIGCDCADEGCCNKNSQCCAKIQGENSISEFKVKFAYNKNRSICVPQGTPVFECNKLCKCGAECMNRVLQQGRKHSLSIFKTANGCGWGVRTNKAIAKGQFVCEYVGEVIKEEEAERRAKICDANGLTYLFDLDFNKNDSKYSIDAAKYGNVSRFFNHSCNPNVGVWAVWIDCPDENLPKIGLFTFRGIDKGEEITIDYTGPIKTEAGTDLDNKTKRMECKCGAENCRKFLF